ncbi:MAG TPA: DUF5666 domain-containing protein [Thermoanaerobaculia bacterium]|nr:DUF5666 domain-containing protein [Thermoanaerobaculia bacterium]
MKGTKKLAALVITVVTLIAPSLFADERHRGRTDNGRHGLRTVNVEGRITDIDRERNGFVIQVNRSNYRLFAPVDTRVVNVSSRNERQRKRVRDLENGDVIRATGRSDERGRVYVESITLLRNEDDRHDQDDRHLRGTVKSINDRRDIIVVQSDRGRSIAVDVRRLERSRRFDLDNLRRGDHVVIRGDWQRDGQFEAERIEIDRRSRW